MSAQLENNKSSISKDSALELYRQMLLIRRTEEMAQKAYDRGKVGGYMHVYIGQEALAVGVISCLKPDDYVLGAYRIHGHALALGMPPEQVLGEIMGREIGCSKGKGGSMHLFDKKRRFLGGYGIVGGNIPIATGVAFSCKYQKTNQVVICFFGDGAVNQGSFHESANMAALWKLPIVFIIENNQYALGTALDRATAETDLYKRAIAYGMPGKRIEAMDVLSVKPNAEEAIQYVREGNGPVMIEAITYRFEGHGAADKIALQTYRSQTEVEAWRKKDPIELMGKRLIAEFSVEPDKLKAIDEEITSIANKAYETADASPEPKLSELFNDVYTDMKPEGHEKWV